MKKKSNQSLTRKYSMYSKYNWTYFATLKVPSFLTIPDINKIMQQFVKRLKYNSYIFYTIEPYKTVDGFHIHCVIKTKDKKDYVKKMWTWFSDTKIDNYNHHCIDMDEQGKVINKAIRYICKDYDPELMNYDFVKYKRPKKSKSKRKRLRIKYKK